jgi:hypothetical protein
MIACDTQQASSGKDLRPNEQAGTLGSAGGSKAQCAPDPVPRVRGKVKAVAFPRGRGPVFVGLGTGGTVRYTEDTRQDDGWYYNKTLWAISPRYGGPVEISGHQVGGPNILLFNAASGFPGKRLAKLRFPSRDERGWRFGPSFTLIRAPGCYAFEIRGEGFADSVTFWARP